MISNITFDEIARYLKAAELEYFDTIFAEMGRNLGDSEFTFAYDSMNDGVQADIVARVLRGELDVVQPT